MIRDHFSRRTNAPQPLLIILAVVWIIVIICVNQASRPQWAWYMVGMAALLTVYVAVRFRLYFGTRNAVGSPGARNPGAPKSGTHKSRN
jgi:hypothetical protein